MRSVLLSLYRKGHALFGRRGILGFRAARAVHDFITSYLKSNYVEVQGHKMLLDVTDSLGLLTKAAHEPLETALVKREVKEGNVVVDLGAHIGYFTLTFARLVGEKGRVIAFEPDPENFALLRRNVEINSYRTVTLLQKAVSNQTGRTRLYLPARDRATPRPQTIFDLGDGRKSIEVEVVRLDDYFAGHEGRIDFIKLDTEGAEFGAIQGMASLLRRNRPLRILTEFWPFGLKRSGVEPADYLGLLREYGFRVYRVVAPVKEADPAELLRMYSTEDEYAYTNLFCVRGESFD